MLVNWKDAGKNYACKNKEVSCFRLRRMLRQIMQQITEDMHIKIYGDELTRP
jgi:hypothetical protein